MGKSDALTESICTEVTLSSCPFNTRAADDFCVPSDEWLNVTAQCNRLQVWLCRRKLYVVVFDHVECDVEAHCLSKQRVHGILK